MAESIVINTGPLITLDRIGALDLPGKLPFAFICPAEVRAEIDAGHRAGHPDIAPEWLRVEPLRAPPSPVAVSALDAGEAAVIHLALERGIVHVCIDEWKGRRAALAAGLKVTGVLGLLGLAKQRQVIQAVKPYIERAVAAGIRYDPELIQRVLEEVGE
ncbi:MAG: DUF3368 domain-containing protein [candidate division NC10 bacterium]